MNVAYRVSPVGHEEVSLYLCLTCAVSGGDEDMETEEIEVGPGSGHLTCEICGAVICAETE